MATRTTPRVGLSAAREAGARARRPTWGTPQRLINPRCNLFPEPHTHCAGESLRAAWPRQSPRLWHVEASGRWKARRCRGPGGLLRRAVTVMRAGLRLARESRASRPLSRNRRARRARRAPRVAARIATKPRREPVRAGCASESVCRPDPEPAGWPGCGPPPAPGDAGSKLAARGVRVTRRAGCGSRRSACARRPSAAAAAAAAAAAWHGRGGPDQTPPTIMGE